MIKQSLHAYPDIDLKLEKVNLHIQSIDCPSEALETLRFLCLNERNISLVAICAVI